MSELLLNELEQPIARFLERHLENTHTWYPHELVDWDEAKSFTPDNPWTPDDYPLSEGVGRALFVNLLTEDNLPYYTSTILAKAPDGHPLNEWTKRWTAEEARHSIVIRDWAIATRALDPRMLEDGRMKQMGGGIVPEPETLADMLAYTSFQEKATQIAHAHTGSKLGKERGGLQVMGKVAGDETLHYNFYKDTVVAGLEIDPSTMIIAIYKQLREFKMPGTGIPDFEAHSEAIARAEIFNASIFLGSVVTPTLDHWKIDKIAETQLNDDAKRARDKIFKTVKLLGRAATIQAESFARETTAQHI